MNKLTIRRGTSTNTSTIEAQTMNQARRRTRSSSVLSVGSVVVVVLVGISVGNWLPAVNCWSLPSRTTKSLDSSFISSSLSPSSVDDSSPPLLKVSNHLPSSPSSTSTSRRSVLSTVVTASAWSFLSLSLIVAPKNVYAAMDDDNSSLFIRKLKVLSDKELTYQIAIPSSMKESSKPIKTHLDEVNFMSESTRGYQYGITVDPVRITSIKEFGTPEEVAARVVTAEVNRDGVFDVTLLEDPYQINNGVVDAYVLKYLSVGKRGRKVYTNKIFISPSQLLYVLTAQCKEDDFPAQEKDIKKTIESFQTSS